MANHEYILKCDTFDANVITKHLEEICQTVLKGLFGVRREDTDDDNAYWFIYFKEDESLLEVGPFELWLDHHDVDRGTYNELEGIEVDNTKLDDEEYEDDEDEFDESYERMRCIEARHKPGDFVWWLDIQVMGNLCRRLNGKMIDEGVGRVFDPNLEKYPTVTAYHKVIWGKVFGTIGSWMGAPHPSLKVFY